MTVLELPVQIKAPDLLKAMEQLPPNEFDELLEQAQLLRQRQQVDAGLLTTIHHRLPIAQRARLQELSSKQEAEEITEIEQTELLQLTDAIEAADVERAEALLVLANKRGLPMRELLRLLNLDTDRG